MGAEGSEILRPMSILSGSEPLARSHTGFPEHAPPCHDVIRMQHTALHSLVSRDRAYMNM